MTIAFRPAGLLAAALALPLLLSAPAEAGGRDDPSELLPPPPIQLFKPRAAEPQPVALPVPVPAPAPAPAPAATATPYGDLIARHAQAAGLPVGLVHAVVRVESNYNPKARGPAGAVGLMQIKPQTARGIGYGGDTSGLYDPDTNLAWGVKYLAGAWQLAGGDLCGTIMRYQGGHRATRMTKANSAYCSRVKKFLAENGY